MGQTIFQTAGGSSSGALVIPKWYVPNSVNHPPAAIYVPVNTTSLECLIFDYQEITYLFGFVPVPDTYTPGVQITLTNGKMFCPNLNTGNYLIRATTKVIRAGESSTGLGSYTSTNTQVAVPGTAILVGEMSDIDLTNSAGSLGGGVNVAAGDTLFISLARLTSTETSGVQDTVNILNGTLGVAFS